MSQRRILWWTLVLLIVLFLPASAMAQTTAYAVVPNSGDDTVSVIDTRTEQVVGVPIAVAPGPSAVAMSPDGRRAYVKHTGEATLTVIDVAGCKKEAEVALVEIPRALAVSPDNRWVYMIHGSGTLSVVNAEGLFLTPYSAAAGVDPISLAITPNGQYAYIGNWADMTIVVVRLTLPNPSVVATLPLTMWPVDIVMAPDGLTAFARLKLPFNGAILPIDLATQTFGAAMAVNPGWDLAITYDGALLYAIGTGFSTTAAVFEAATGTGVGSIPLNLGAGPMATTPNGNFVYVLDSPASAVAIIDRWAQVLTGRSIAVGLNPADVGIGPSVIIQQSGPSIALSIARDSDLTAAKFGAFVPFNGGTLKTTGPWTTTRTLSLLAGGGTIETRSPAVINASTIGPGVLTKTGPSSLVLSGVTRHARTIVKSGVLSVMTLHASPVVVDGGTLSGTGTLGHVTALRGTIAPSSTLGPGILHAATVTMSAAMTFAVTMVSAADGGYSRLEATNSVHLGNAVLTINPKFTPQPGQTFTIVTNAIGEFANYGEGDVISTPRGLFTISYQGGPLGQDVVLTAL